MAGRNSEARSDSARNAATVIARSGAVSSAIAYQRALTRHFSSRETNSRSPARPCTSQVKRMPATLGPASIARKTNGNSGSFCAVVPGISPGPPMTNRMPPHEIANVRAK